MSMKIIDNYVAVKVDEEKYVYINCVNGAVDLLDEISHETVEICIC